MLFLCVIDTACLLKMLFYIIYSAFYQLVFKILCSCGFGSFKGYVLTVEITIKKTLLLLFVFCHNKLQISEIAPQFKIVIHGEIGSAKGMFAQHEMNLVWNLLLSYSTLQTSIHSKRAA